MPSSPDIHCNRIYDLRPDQKIVCCDSCHDEWEGGYSEPCSVTDPYTNQPGNHYGGVCCTLSQELKEKPLTKEEWDKLPQAYVPA